MILHKSLNMNLKFLLYIIISKNKEYLMSNQKLFIIQIICLLVISTLSFYSKHYKKCLLPLSKPHKFDLGSVKI
jgi:hypothetical protein